jgi:hypothetical protein
MQIAGSDSLTHVLVLSKAYTVPIPGSPVYKYNLASANFAPHLPLPLYSHPHHRQCLRALGIAEDVPRVLGLRLVFLHGHSLEYV